MLPPFFFMCLHKEYTRCDVICNFNDKERCSKNYLFVFVSLVYNVKIFTVALFDLICLLVQIKKSQYFNSRFIYVGLYNLVGFTLKKLFRSVLVNHKFSFAA